MKAHTQVIIVGAGAAGLMAARELAKAGRDVLILEARNRIGGRIFSLSEKDFGYPAQGGAEFVHGHAAVTKSLLKEAGLTYESMPNDGEMWNFRDGQLEKSIGDPLENPQMQKHKSLLHQKLSELTEDLPIASFLEQNFADEEYAPLRQWIKRMVEGFDAADPNQISTFSIRDEWLGSDEWEQGRVKEGYKALLDFLESECKKLGVIILFDQEVESIEIKNNSVTTTVADGKTYRSLKIIVTVPLPIINQLQFDPPLQPNSNVVKDIGFGQVIKLLFRFKNSFWPKQMSFLFSDQAVPAWWTQYPQPYPVLTGWIAGPKALLFKNKSNDEILALGIESLSKIFQIEPEKLKEEMVVAKVINWPKDPFAQGAYSYSTVKSKEAYAQLRQPIGNRIFFAGEALYNENETATVEGALGSGAEVARKIINLNLVS